MIQKSHFWVYIQKNWNQDLKRDYLRCHVYPSTICSRDVKTTRMSIDEWMDKENVVYT